MLKPDIQFWNTWHWWPWRDECHSAILFMKLPPGFVCVQKHPLLFFLTASNEHVNQRRTKRRKPGVVRRSYTNISDTGGKMSWIFTGMLCWAALSTWTVWAGEEMVRKTRQIIYSLTFKKNQRIRTRNRIKTSRTSGICWLQSPLPFFPQKSIVRNAFLSSQVFLASYAGINSPLCMRSTAALSNEKKNQLLKELPSAWKILLKIPSLEKSSRMAQCKSDQPDQQPWWDFLEALHFRSEWNSQCTENPRDISRPTSLRFEAALSKHSI